MFYVMKMAVFWVVAPCTTHKTAIFVLTAVRSSNSTCVLCHVPALCNIAAEGLGFLLRILGVPDSNLLPETGYPEIVPGFPHHHGDCLDDGGSRHF
jgi:hypothetical protein